MDMDRGEVSALHVDAQKNHGINEKNMLYFSCLFAKRQRDWTAC